MKKVHLRAFSICNANKDKSCKTYKTFYGVYTHFNLAAYKNNNNNYERFEISLLNVDILNYLNQLRLFYQVKN